MGISKRTYTRVQCYSLPVICFLIFALSFSAVYAEQVTSSKQSSKTNKECGPKSLLAICQILGVEANLEELCHLSSMSEDGTTMLGLYQAAQRKGLKAEGLKMGIAELARLKTLAIVHTKNNHFFVVERFRRGKFHITDPPKESYYLTKERLSQIWDGNVLVVSRKPPSKTRGPNIIFEEYLYDFGKTDQNQKISHTYKFKNTGKKKLVISKVRSSCGCMAALLSDKEIPPGGNGQVELKFDTGQRRGRQMHSAYVHSNAADEPIVKLTLTGKIKAYMTCSPSRVYLGNIQSGKGAISKINILEGEESLKIDKVETSSEHLFTQTFYALYGKRTGYEVIVALSPETPIGTLKEKVIIYTDNSKKPKIEIPVEGEVKGPITVYPKSLFFGFIKKGDSLTREVTISTTAPEELLIQKVGNSMNCLSVQLIPLENGRKYTLKARLKPNASKGSIKGDIKVHTNNSDQAIVEVPVYGLVED